MAMASRAHPDWQVVVPVKGGPAAKTRLSVGRRDLRSAIAQAIAQDSVAAAVECMPSGHLLVATADDEVAVWAGAAGARVVRDPGTGLRDAVRAGVDAVRGNARRGRRGPAPVAVLLGDVPALRADDLRAALDACAEHPAAFVPDRDGTGTVLLTALDVDLLRPAFGRGSASAHAHAGHVRVDLDLARLRTDVDDPVSLAAALALGVGPRTASVLRDHGATVRGTLPVMQASVHTFDPATGAGTALLDDGREVRFTGEVFARSGLRHLRVGQRVSVEVDDREVGRLWIVGIGEGERIG